MAKLNATRGGQYVMASEFVFNFDDNMKDITGADKVLGAAAGAGTFSVINLPDGAIVIGGSIVTETAFNGTTFGIAVGDTAVTNRYLATADRKGAARVALVPTGYRSSGENIVIVTTPTGTHTAGKMTVRVEYVTTGRVNEVNPN